MHCQNYLSCQWVPLSWQPLNCLIILEYSRWFIHQFPWSKRFLESSCYQEVINCVQIKTYSLCPKVRIINVSTIDQSFSIQSNQKLITWSRPTWIRNLMLPTKLQIVSLPRPLRFKLPNAFGSGKFVINITSQIMERSSTLGWKSLQSSSCGYLSFKDE